MVQEVTTRSWGSRIMNALWGVLFGIAFIIGAFILIFWNEGNGLHTAQSLEQAQHVLITVPNAPVDPKNEMRVVYLSGLATTEETLTDNLLKVSEKAIQLNRHVEMYQWEEKTETKTEKNLGGSEQETKTYSYEPVWSAKLIDSSHFKEQDGHKNPAMMPIKSKIQYADKVTVGDFLLPASLITDISGDTPVDLSKADLDALKTKYNKPVKQQADGLYFGDEAESPAIGDMRLTMTMVLPKTVSVIAQQTGTTLQPYLADAGRTVSLLEVGQVSSQQMIQNAESENRIITWLLRLASLVAMIMGFALIMQPIVILADVVPFFGNLAGFGTGLIAFVVGLGLWTIAIAIAWFAVRPLWAVGLIMMVAGVCYFLIKRKARQPIK